MNLLERLDRFITETFEELHFYTQVIIGVIGVVLLIMIIILWIHLLIVLI